MIKIIDLYKGFDKPVLNGVNIQIEDGQIHTIIGGSGCGKSVLLKLIVGILIPDRGSIIIDGVDITKLSEVEKLSVQKNFGFLFQAAALFDSLTVFENIAFEYLYEKNDMKKLEELVARKLIDVGLEPSVMKLKPAALSGGMRKRVGLARALAKNPKYILYDEPTTGLDPIVADRINDLIIETKNKFNVTSIVVTHDMKSAYKISDRISMLYEGKIIFTGTPHEVQTADNPYVKQFITGSSQGPIKVIE